MDIQLKLSKDFERFLEELKQKYGEDFEYINGLHPSQLDFSEFINNFVGHDTLADASIDPNANANTKDIRSFMTEKGKSEDKLFGLNKIFMEIKKMWGLRTAKQWLEQEFSRGFYLNDSAGDLAQTLVGKADDRDVFYLGILLEEVLDLNGVDVLSAGNDEILLTVNEEVETIFVLTSHVAGE